MPTILLTHSDCLDHEMPAGHPECFDRLRAVLAALKNDAFSALEWVEAPKARTEELTRAHPPAYVEQLLAAVPGTGERFVFIDGDTSLSPGSGKAALRAAGAVVEGVNRVMTGKARNAFCAVRPPGHHATATQAMGFCFFNSVAVGAFHARAVHGAERVAVIDFDVHHGNGTQDIFWNEPDLFYGSVHQSPLYPGTGAPNETGCAGNIVNAILRSGADGIAFREAMNGKILPALEAARPDLILISAGFDAHARDPLAGLMLTETDFAWATEVLMEAAEKLCQGRIVSSLEGGYDLTALASSAAAHVRTLMKA